MKNAISPTREEDFPEWFQQIVRHGELAEHSPVRGCMVILPWGYGIWENMQRVLDLEFKRTGHQNAYFPLFIPLELLQKEADHVEGFAKECAVVTHHRLEVNAEGKLVPAGPLEEPLIVRPTSETIIGEMFSKWITSYRDLPLLINQWANVVRWEMRTRLFLRTMEFLWQEGHTVHATREEAIEETMQMLEIYAQFGKNYLAIPFIKGEKSESERFPGAASTFTIEAMMQDRKALQGGTSHFLGQNFSKASNIRFRDAQGVEQYGWTTSWGATTRLIGAMAMIHGDDDGLRLPPRMATQQVVILPIIHKEETRADVLRYCQSLAEEIRLQVYYGRPIQVLVDTRDMRGGDKTWSWIKKGVPLRIEVGPRDIEGGQLPVFRRDLPHKQSQLLRREEIVQTLASLLDQVHDSLYEKALLFRDRNIHRIDDQESFYQFFTPKNREKPEIHGGFAYTHWNRDPKVEEKIKRDLGVTVRCIPLEGENEEGICPFSGQKSPSRVLFAKSY